MEPMAPLKGVHSPYFRHMGKGSSQTPPEVKLWFLESLNCSHLLSDPLILNTGCMLDSSEVIKLSLFPPKK